MTREEIIAKYIQGIDIEPINDPDIVLGNMENYDFGRRFDVIIAGDVLEHVDNQSLFLNNVKKHLKKEGYLILTTPNAKWPTVFLKPNPTHTLWHDKYTLSYLLKRSDFKTVFFSYYPGNKKHNIFKKVLVLKQGIIVVCQKND